MLHPTIRWTIARLLQHLNSARHTWPLPARLPRQDAVGPAVGGRDSARLLVEEPDWALLDDFYANPAGHGWQTELEIPPPTGPVAGKSCL